MRVKNLNLWPIGNCQVSALVDDEASLVWACQPRVDGDPLFCSLLDPAGESPLPRGQWGIAVEDQVSCTQSYLRNTPILVSRLTDKDGGIAEVYDFCPRFARNGRMYRPVAFIRIVRPIAGAPRVRMTLNPATAWGARDAERTSGSNHIRFLLEPQALRLTTDAPVTHLLEGAASAGKAAPLLPRPRRAVRHQSGHSVATMLHQTSDEWRDWVRGLAVPLEWQKVVIRAAITLKLCQHEETGAIVRRSPPRCPRRRTRPATGTIATAGSATLIIRCRRSTGSARWMCWRTTSPTSATSWTPRPTASSSRSTRCRASRSWRSRSRRA
jgi:GH15 family glucan-1,4-alpha-glucosidase